MSTEEWSVLITAEGGGDLEADAADFDRGGDCEAAEDRLAAELDRHQLRATTVTIGSGQLEATVRASAPTIDKALARVLDCWSAAVSRAGLPDWPVVRADIATYPVRERQSEAPVVPELVDAETASEILEGYLGTAEVASFLGVTKPRISTLRQNAGFPRPVAELRAGPVWTSASIAAFARGWEHRVGRPPGRASYEQVPPEQR